MTPMITVTLALQPRGALPCLSRHCTASGDMFLGGRGIASFVVVEEDPAPPPPLPPSPSSRWPAREAAAAVTLLPLRLARLGDTLLLTENPRRLPALPPSPPSPPSPLERPLPPPFPEASTPPSPAGSAASPENLDPTTTSTSPPGGHPLPLLLPLPPPSPCCCAGVGGTRGWSKARPKVRWVRVGGHGDDTTGLLKRSPKVTVRREAGQAASATGWLKWVPKAISSRPPGNLVGFRFGPFSFW